MNDDGEKAKGRSFNVGDGSGNYLTGARQKSKM